MRLVIPAVLLAALAALAVSRWYRGWRSVIEHENANAVVTSLAESTRGLHLAEQARVLDDERDGA